MQRKASLGELSGFARTLFGCGSSALGNAMYQRSVLVLNQNYVPIHICNARRAINLLFKRKAELIEQYADLVKSANFVMPIPSVIRLHYFVHRPHFRISLNRRNILRRDDYTCQYCGDRVPLIDLTVDHILPRSKGGDDSWINMVTACRQCNNQKANRTPKQANMPLLRKPKDPSLQPALLLSWRMPAVQESWQPYLIAVGH